MLASLPRNIYPRRALTTTAASSPDYNLNSEFCRNWATICRSRY
ncbi:hypothetical protein A464_3765 [Salmonella bongori N268-08]|uniref:Uncharacterized protein n=1 Tax=Salmonella bongori N268-08 TaxID=1197719 RepID=S5N235_SALBN|nr:hypothetical protein A464_3765 [Salmonella bongori N268-08]